MGASTIYGAGSKIGTKYLAEKLFKPVVIFSHKMAGG